MSSQLLAAAIIVLLLDWGSKRLVTARLLEGEQRRIAPFVRVRRHTRHGLAFLDVERRWLLLLGGAVVFVLIDLELRYTNLLWHPLTHVGVGAAVGGAFANLWDRVSSRGIVDFVSIGRWPTFNVADAAITCGVVIAIWSVLG